MQPSPPNFRSISANDPVGGGDCVARRIFQSRRHTAINSLPHVGDAVILGAADKYLSKYAANDDIQETFRIEFIAGQAGHLGQETIFFHLGF